MLSVGELKAILQNWSDDTPVCVRVYSYVKMITPNKKKIIIIISKINLDFIKIVIIFVIQN